MFALTPRLTLRPGWPEDAPALSMAIGHEAVVRNLARAPWPYAADDAAAFLALDWRERTTRFLICERTDGRIVGGIGIDVGGAHGNELGYWLTPSVWGRGYATEAGHAVIAIARSLGLTRLDSGHFADNAASGRVLAKLGFRPTGRVAPRYSLARDAEVPSVLHELTLAAANGPVALAA